jgi:hypothetical protein
VVHGGTMEVFNENVVVVVDVDDVVVDDDDDVVVVDDVVVDDVDDDDDGDDEFEKLDPSSVAVCVCPKVNESSDT